MALKSYRRIAADTAKSRVNYGNTSRRPLERRPGENWHMKIRLLLFAVATFSVIGSLGAGTLELQPKETAAPSIPQSEPWQFTIAVPGWLAGLDGTIGVRGVNADIDIGFEQVPQHLDMLFAARAEARKGRLEYTVN